MKTCNVNLEKKFSIAALFKERVRCGKPAAYQGVGGETLCVECAEELVNTTFAEKNILGMMLAARGSMPSTVEEAWKRWLIPIQ